MLVLRKELELVTGATINNWREGEHLTACRNMKLLIGGVSELLICYFKVCLHSAFLQFVDSGPNSQHSACYDAWKTFQRNCIMLRISAIIVDLKVI